MCTNTEPLEHSNKLSFDGGIVKMTEKEAAGWILMLFRKIDPTDTCAARVSEAVSLAVWALMEQARYEA